MTKHHGNPHQRPKPPRPHGDVPFASRLIDQAGNFSLVVDGSANPIDYTFVPADDLVVTELALMFEGNGPIDFGDKFASIDMLMNGIAIELQSYGHVIQANFTTTRDLMEYSSPCGFQIESGGGSNIIKATRHFTQGLTLRDRYGDHIKLVVRDNLTKLTYGIASVLGYTA
jgi:hypothetical protein